MKETAALKSNVILLCEWDEQEFRKKLTYWESKGYRACFNTCKVEPDRDPCTGRMYLRYSIGLEKPAHCGTEQNESGATAQGVT